MEQLKEILHQSPRDFGKATSLWTLALVAEVSYENELIKERVSSGTIRATLNRFGMKWTRAKHWITSPTLMMRGKKTKKALDKITESQADWAYSFQDETWWNRFFHPDLHSWVEDEQFTKLVEQVYTKNDPDPKALACFGLLVHWQNKKAQIKEKVWLHFVKRNPCSDLTIKYLRWVCSKALQSGKPVLVMFWGHAPWHISRVR
jgi:hypothetical protein